MNCRKDLIRIAQCNWMAFLNRYREYYTDEFIERFSTAEKGIDKLHILDDEARRQGYPLYLIIECWDFLKKTYVLCSDIIRKQGSYKETLKK